MKHTDKPGGKARPLRPLTEAEREAAANAVPMGQSPCGNPTNTHGGFESNADWAIVLLAAVGFFNPPSPPPGKHEDGRGWNDAMLTIQLLRMIATRRNWKTGNCYPGYETTAQDIGIPGAGRHVQRLAERLLFKPGYLGRYYSAAKGSSKTIRFYDFGPLLAAAEIVEGGEMPTIEPPAGNPCNRSGAEAMGARDCNRSGAVTIATAPPAADALSLQPLAPEPLQPLAPRTLATAQGAVTNTSSLNTEEQVCVFEHAHPDSSGFEVSPPSPSSDFAAWARMQKDPVTVALEATGEGDGARPVYGSRLAALRALKGKDKGARLFVAVCETFHAECEAGEKADNPGAVLTKRLDALLARLKGEKVPKTSTPPPAPLSPVSVAEAKRPPADETPAEAQRRNRAAIEQDKREHPERWGLAPAQTKRTRRQGKEDNE